MEVNRIQSSRQVAKPKKSIEATIDVGANAIAYTAYSMMQEYFHTKMELYRK